MPKAACDFTTSNARPAPKIERPGRRAFLSASAALLAAGPTAAAGGLAAPHPDAELLALLAEFDAIELQIRAAGEGALAEALCECQGDIIDRLCSIRATTADGFRARARSFLLFDGGADIPEADDPDDYHDNRMIGALLRDLAADGAA